MGFFSRSSCIENRDYANNFNIILKFLPKTNFRKVKHDGYHECEIHEWELNYHYKLVFSSKDGYHLYAYSKDRSFYFSAWKNTQEEILELLEVLKQLG